MSNANDILYYRLEPVYSGDAPSPTRAILNCAVTGDRLATTGGGGLAISAHVIEGLMVPVKGWNDRPDDFTVQIDAAHPAMPFNKDDEDRWDRYLRARTLVNNRHSKNALIDVIHWLLTRAERAEGALAEIGVKIEGSLDETVAKDEIAFEGDDEATAVIAFIRGIADVVKRGLGGRHVHLKVKAA